MLRDLDALQQRMKGVEEIVIDCVGTAVPESVYVDIGKHALRRYNSKISLLKKLPTIINTGRHRKKKDFKSTATDMLKLGRGLDASFLDYFGAMLAEKMDIYTTGFLQMYRHLDINMVTRDVQYVQRIIGALRDLGINIRKYISNEVLVENGKLTDKVRPYAVGVKWDGGPIMTAQDKLDAFLAIARRPISKVAYLCDNDPVENMVKDYVKKSGGLVLTAYELRSFIAPTLV